MKYCNVFGLINDSPEVRAAMEEVTPEMAEFSSSITSNDRLWSVIRQAATQPWVRQLSPARQRFVQEVVAVATALQKTAPETEVAIELGGEDAKIIYFSDGNIEQRMNGICAGGTGSFIDQMASLLQTDAIGLNEYAKSYKVTREFTVLTKYCKLFYFLQLHNSFY